MVISDDDIEDFIRRWENAFDERLSANEARARALELIELYRAIGGPLPPEGEEGECGAGGVSG